MVRVGGLRLLTLYLSFTLTAATSTTCDCAGAALAGDPHVRGAHGDRFSVRGEPGGVYNLLSLPNVSFNTEFVSSVFKSPFSRLRVNGSFARHAYWKLRTPQTGKMLYLKYHAGDYTHPELSGDFGLHYMRENEPFSLEGITIWLNKKFMTVDAGGFRMIAESTVGYPHWGQLRMNLRTIAHGSACELLVAPHGILGQTFDCDDLAVIGNEDKYTTTDDGAATNRERRADDHRPLVTTRAQGEGALEGDAHDYRMLTAHGSDFAFSRFDAIMPVAPRNASLLAGVKRKRARRRLTCDSAAFSAQCGATPAGSGGGCGCFDYETSTMCQLAAPLPTDKLGLERAYAQCFGAAVAGSGGDDETAAPNAAREAAVRRVPIASLAAGDFVLSMTEEGHLFVDRLSFVLHTAVVATRNLVTLRHSHGELTLTPTHLLHVDGAFVAARDARVGSTLTLPNGRQAVVQEAPVQFVGRIAHPIPRSCRLLVAGATGEPVLNHMFDATPDQAFFRALIEAMEAKLPLPDGRVVTGTIPYPAFHAAIYAHPEHLQWFVDATEPFFYGHKPVLGGLAAAAAAALAPLDFVLRPAAELAVRLFVRHHGWIAMVADVLVAGLFLGFVHARRLLLTAALGAALFACVATRRGKAASRH